MFKYLLAFLNVVMFCSCNSSSPDKKQFAEKIKKNLEDNVFKLNSTLNILELNIIEIQERPLDSIFKQLCYERISEIEDSIKNIGGVFTYQLASNDNKYNELLHREKIYNSNIKGYYVFYSVKGVLMDASDNKKNILHDRVISYFDNKNNLLYNKLYFRNKVATVNDQIYEPKETPIEKNISSNYFTIGSTEEDVLNVQGKPTSINDASFFKMYSYGGSNVTFENGVVKSYYNNGNLKIKVAIDNSNSNLPKEKEVVKYVYYTFQIAKVSSDTAYIDGYSSIFQINEYNIRKVMLLLLCLEDAFEKETGLPVITSEHVFDDKEAALIHWNRERGNLFEESTCQEHITAATPNNYNTSQPKIFNLGDALITDVKNFKLLGISSQTSVFSYQYIGNLSNQYYYGRKIGDIIIGVKNGKIVTTIYNLVPEINDVDVPSEILELIQKALPFPLAHINGAYGVNIDNTSISISRTNNVMTFNKDRIMFFTSVKQSVLNQ